MRAGLRPPRQDRAWLQEAGLQRRLPRRLGKVPDAERPGRGERRQGRGPTCSRPWWSCGRSGRWRWRWASPASRPSVSGGCIRRLTRAATVVHPDSLLRKETSGSPALGRRAGRSGVRVREPLLRRQRLQQHRLRRLRGPLIPLRRCRAALSPLHVLSAAAAETATVPGGACRSVSSPSAAVARRWRTPPPSSPASTESRSGRSPATVSRSTDSSPSTAPHSASLCTSSPCTTATVAPRSLTRLFLALAMSTSCTPGRRRPVENDARRRSSSLSPRLNLNFSTALARRLPHPRSLGRVSYRPVRCAACFRLARAAAASRACAARVLPLYRVSVCDAWLGACGCLELQWHMLTSVS